MPTEEETKAAEAKAAADKAATDKAKADEKKPDDKKDEEHASRVIERLNKEAQANREKAEAAEKRAVEAEKKLSEKEKAELAEQKKYQELYEKEKADRTKEAEQYRTDLSARDSALVREAVMREAVKAGILDEDDIDLPVFEEAIKLAKVDGRKVIGATDVVAAMKKSKPSKFKAEETDEEREAREKEEKARDERGRFTKEKERPNPNDKKGAVDWSKLSDADFAAKEEQLRRGRAA